MSAVLSNRRPVQTNQIKAIALRRHLEAGERFIDSASQNELKRVANANDDISVLTQELEIAWSREHADPLARFKRAGVRAKQKMLQAEGGICSDAEAAKRLGITCRALSRRQASRRIVAIALGGEFVYPVWQFETPVRRGISRVLPALPNDAQDFELLSFFLEPNLYSDGDSPLDALRAGNLRGALRAAKSYLQQGAA